MVSSKCIAVVSGTSSGCEMSGESSENTVVRVEYRLRLVSSQWQAAVVASSGIQTVSAIAVAERNGGCQGSLEPFLNM